MIENSSSNKNNLQVGKILKTAKQIFHNFRDFLDSEYFIQQNQIW